MRYNSLTILDAQLRFWAAVVNWSFQFDPIQDNLGLFEHGVPSCYLLQCLIIMFDIFPH